MIDDDYLIGYLLDFLTLEDQFVMSRVSKRFLKLINIPQYYGKKQHFEQLTKKYNLGFLFECVSNYTQALILYNSVPNIMTDYYINNLKDKKIKKIFRNIMYKDCVNRNTKLKLLRVR